MSRFRQTSDHVAVGTPRVRVLCPPRDMYRIWRGWWRNSKPLDKGSMEEAANVFIRHCFDSSGSLARDKGAKDRLPC